jgi:diaminopimelate decarboxylase
MTLPDLIPSLRSSLLPPLPVEVWPSTVRRHERGEIRVGGVGLTDIAKQFGTPTYVLDESDVRMRCRAYLAAFGAGAVAYSAKALLCRAVARWIAEEGLGLYVSSAGELAVASAAGVPADRLVLHGVAKTPEDLRAAFQHRVGRIVVESLSEVPRLAAEAPRGQRLVLRVQISAERRGTPAGSNWPDERRFGLRIDIGEATDAARRIVAQPGLKLVGLDCSLGTQISRFNLYERGIKQLVDFLGELRHLHGVVVDEINLGGGHAVPHTGEEAGFALEAFAMRVRGALALYCDRQNLPVPRLTVSPGRAIIARAGVTLYRAVAVTRIDETRQLVAVDGGMSDSPATAIYGCRQSAALVGRIPQATSRRTLVVGRHHEAGDVVAGEVDLPGDVHPGDLLAVPCTGAYHLSLASNYHLVTRPPLVAVRDGDVRTLLGRETVEALLARDTGGCAA